MIAVGLTPGINRPSFPPGFEVHALTGSLSVPRRARGVVMIPTIDRGRAGNVGQSIDAALREAGLATCHVNLLDAGEAHDASKTSDVPFLVHRLTAALEFLRARPQIAALPLGLLGSHRMAAVVLAAAARHPSRIRAVLCHCGRDMTGIDASKVRAPALLIVPGRDEALIAAGQEVFWQLECSSQLAVVKGASRHFAEGGTLLACRQLITQWCRRHLGRPSRPDGFAPAAQPHA